jgi:hypothetical protein
MRHLRCADATLDAGSAASAAPDAKSREALPGSERDSADAAAGPRHRVRQVRTRLDSLARRTISTLSLRRARSQSRRTCARGGCGRSSTPVCQSACRKRVLRLPVRRLRALCPMLQSPQRTPRPVGTFAPSVVQRCGSRGRRTGFADSYITGVDTDTRVGYINSGIGGAGSLRTERRRPDRRSRIEDHALSSLVHAGWRFGAERRSAVGGTRTRRGTSCSSADEPRRSLVSVF